MCPPRSPQQASLRRGCATKVCESQSPDSLDHSFLETYFLEGSESGDKSFLFMGKETDCLRSAKIALGEKSFRVTLLRHTSVCLKKDQCQDLPVKNRLRSATHWNLRQVAFLQDTTKSTLSLTLLLLYHYATTNFKTGTCPWIKTWYTHSSDSTPLYCLSVGHIQSGWTAGSQVTRIEENTKERHGWTWYPQWSYVA